jgi:flagellar motor switch/type III secretory pathway protein FliN
MSSPAVAAYPWERVPRVARAAVTARRDVVARVFAALDPARCAGALSQLLGEGVEVPGVYFSERRRVDVSASLLTDAVTLQFAAQGLRLTLQPEADLVRVCVARLLEQDFELGWADTGVDAALRGAGAALLLEVARRAARGQPPELTAEGVASGAWLLCATVTVRLGAKPYRLELCAELLDGPRPLDLPKPRVALRRLGAVRLQVPWICAVTRMGLRELERLEVGDVWLPGGSAWLDRERPLGAGLLASPRSERGLPVHVSGGRIVLGANAVVVPEELESSMNQEESELEQIVGETPLTVRLEVGALEMSAAEWAALRPGDVVQSGRRIDHAVILRTGGREIARGELVDIEGEIGVRITQVGLVKAPP